MTEALESGPGRTKSQYSQLQSSMLLLCQSVNPREFGATAMSSPSRTQGQKGAEGTKEGLWVSPKSLRAAEGRAIRPGTGCLLKLSPGGAGRPLLGVWKPQGCPEAALPPDCSIGFDAATALQRDTQDGSAAKAIAC